MTLKEIFNTSMAELDAHSQAFPWQNREAYAHYLAQTYYYVSHSTRLLAAAASRFSAQDEALHRRYLEHTTEEKSHHLLALHDLKALGGTTVEFPELAITSAFYESQYYKVDRQDPTALLGYILALEGYAVSQGTRVYKIVSEKFGKPASTFIKVHSEDDPDHLDKAFASLTSLRTEQLEHVTKNLKQSCYLLGGILNECAQAAHMSPLKKAA